MSQLQDNLNEILRQKNTYIIPANIRSGVEVLGVTGSMEPDKPDQTKTCTPTTSQQVISADTGYELTSVTVNGVTASIDANIVAGNIKNGVSILGVNGTYGSDGNALASQVLKNRVFYTADGRHVGTLEPNMTYATSFSQLQTMAGDSGRQNGDIVQVIKRTVSNGAGKWVTKLYLPETITLPRAISSDVQWECRTLTANGGGGGGPVLTPTGFDIFYMGGSR